MDLAVGVDDPLAPDVRAVLEAHLAFAREVTPADHVHALGVDALASPDVTVFSVRRGGQVVGVGALRHLDATHVELKSMHTAAAARSTGVGRALLLHLLGEAQARGYRRVSLETGTYPAFAPARALYSSAGFVPCPPFGPYTDNPFSVCMTRRLQGASGRVPPTMTTGELGDERLGQIHRLCVEAFDGSFTDDDWEHTIGGHHAVIVERDTVVAHAAVVERLLTAGDRSLRTGYVEGVAISPSRRGVGLGTTVLRAVQRRIVSAFELGALSTGERGFYERLGWESWRGPTSVRTAAGTVRTPEDDEGIMVLRFGPSAGIDLREHLVCDERNGDDW